MSVGVQIKHKTKRKHILQIYMFIFILKSDNIFLPVEMHIYHAFG